jgi:transcriptional regulator with XRE-family HTH domain
MASTYGEVIAANVRATRVRKQLHQADVVERMRALGYTDWHRQTLGKVERGERSLRAAEVLGLAYALGTNMGVLLAAEREDVIEFPTGQLTGRDVTAVAFGRNNGAIRWGGPDGNEPIFGNGVDAWRGEPEDDPARDLV